jgi:hypothetical protein
VRETFQQHSQSKEVIWVSVCHIDGTQRAAFGFDPIGELCRMGFAKKRVYQKGIVVIPEEGRRI